MLSIHVSNHNNNNPQVVKRCQVTGDEGPCNKRSSLITNKLCKLEMTFVLFHRQAHKLFCQGQTMPSMHSPFRLRLALMAAALNTAVGEPISTACASIG